MTNIIVIIITALFWQLTFTHAKKIVDLIELLKIPNYEKVLHCIFYAGANCWCIYA
jgi:hypothetical protein